VSELASDPTTTVPAPVAPPDQAVATTSFDNLTVNVRRNTDKGQWELFVLLGSVEWVFGTRKLGGLDDDLQEAATPGFKEKRRLYYEREVLGLR
jgi:hypothetical protein